MSRTRLFIVCWFLLMTPSHYGQCCGPVEIGQQYTIISTASVPPDANVLWLLDYQYVVYDSTLSNPNPFPTEYNGTRTQITILNVTTDDGIAGFYHIVSPETSRGFYYCQLPVYIRPSYPTCEPVALFGNEIKTTCTTAQVYPQAKCQFSLLNRGIDEKDITDGTSYITYNHSDPQPERDYYSTSCTLQYPVNGLKPGLWRVQVNMYPDETGVSLAQGTIAQAGNPLQLSVPTVSIDPNNCPKGLAGEDDTLVRDGYIKQGERATCQCTRAHAGNPIGSISWRSTKGENIEILSRSTNEVTIKIKSWSTFTCQSTSVLDSSHSLTYTPKYAYGPSSASIFFQRLGPIYLCPNQQTNIGITCQVPANSFNPPPLFRIQDGKSTNLVTKVAGDTAQSKSVNYNFTKSGKHTFMCRVENAIFSDIFSEAPAKAIQVYAPPNSPPSIQVTGRSVITDNSETWIKQGSALFVSCSAGEAYPLVSSVTVTCGQETSSSGQLDVSAVSGDNMRCQCSVDHETKVPCNGLNLNKEITIQTAYGPNEISISFADDRLRNLPNSPLNLCSSESLDLTVICAVKQSDVRPALTNSSFTLTKPTTFTTHQTYFGVSGGHYRLVNGLKVNSEGSHNLVCEARNLKFSDIKQVQSMTIEVRVPPNRPPSIQVTGRSVITDNSETWIKQGSALSVSCSAGEAYPLVKSVTVTCGQETSLSGQLAVSAVSGDNMRCQCSVDHETKVPCNGLNLNQEITLQTAYGPNKVSIGFADEQLRSLPNSPLNLCSSESLDLTVICAVKQSDVRPGLTNSSFTLTKPTTFTTQHTYFDISEVGVYRSVNKLKVTSGGSHTLVCESRNPKFSDIKQNQFMILDVREPPSDPPRISAQSTQNGGILVEGDDVLVTCNTSGGYPSVQSVTLSCSHDRSTTNKGTLATLILNKVELSYSNKHCTCQATHVTGCYDLMGDLSLIIFSNNSTKAGRNEDTSLNSTEELAGIVIGSIVGILVLAAVIALIVFFFRREKAKREKRNNDRDYDTIERPPAPDQRYQNVRPRDPTYETIKHAGHPNKENVNNKTENIDLNDIEAVEDDAHVYNEINDSEDSTKQETEANSRTDQAEPTEPYPYTEILD